LKTFPAKELHDLGKELFIACDAPAAEADDVAAHLVEASLMGIDSHGVVRYIWYVEQCLEGGICPGAQVQVLRDGGHVALVDCAMNFGQVGAGFMVDLVRSRCVEAQYAADVQHHFTGLDQVFLSAHDVPTLWFQRSPQLTWHTRADISQDVSPAAMRASIGAAVDIARHVDSHPGAFQSGIPADQASQIRDYVANGAPCW